MNLFEIVLTLKRRMRLIIAFVVLCAIAALFIADGMQSYTARMYLKYRHSGAEAGLTPDGSALNAYEIMNPQVIAIALDESDSGAGMTVEEVRNKLAVNAVVDSMTTKVQEAAVEKGEKYEVQSTEYLISYSYGRAYGDEFGNRMLYSLAEAYDQWFADKYYPSVNVVNFLDNVSVSSMDYMELCEFMEPNLDSVIGTLDGLDLESAGFRSDRTGMDFSVLSNCFSDIRDGDLQKYRANIWAGLLSKDKEKFIKSCQSRIGTMHLTMVNSRADSDLCYEMLQGYYEQYKDSAPYSMSARQPEGDSEAQPYGSGLSPTIFTYDDIVLRFVESGVTAAELKRETDHLARLIVAYQNDAVPQEVKAVLIEANALLYDRMYQNVARYVELANQTIRDYYDRLVAQDLSYLTTVAVTQNLSVKMVVLAGAAIGGAFICAACIFSEMFRRYREHCDVGHQSGSQRGKGNGAAAVAAETNPS